MVGETLSHYQILGKIGEGGMGVVYRARDTRLKRIVALKLLKDNSADRDSKRRFLQEARAASALNHPNIVTVYDVGAHGGSEFIAMEYVDGMSLKQKLARGALPLREVLKYACQIASALAKAHAEGIIHRDLKPANVLLAADSTVKLVDFGLAKIATPVHADAGAETCSYLESASVSTDKGVIAGTAAYMSPEQAEGRALDARGDVFSFGAVLYEMLTGRRAFQGTSAISTLAAVLREEPAPISQISPAVPREVERLVSRCLRKHPAERFQHMGDLSFALQELLEDTDSGRLPAATPEARRRPWLPAVMAALLVVSALAAILLLRGHNSALAGPIEFTRMTAEPGEELSPSFMPDGWSFVYTGRGPHHRDIFLRRIGSPKALNLTSDDAHDHLWPAVSPDGALIAFSHGPDDPGIFVMGASGDSVRRLTSFGAAPAWSPDGKQLAFSTEALVRANFRSVRQSQLWILDIASGATRRIEVPDAVQPAWSPDGRRIVFWNTAESGQRDIYTVAAQPGVPPGMLAVTSDWDLDSHPVWAPDGSHIYYTSTRGGTPNLWRIRVDPETGRPEGAPEPVTTPSNYSLMVTISRDGKRFLYVDLQVRENIAAAGFDPAAGRLAAEHRLLTSGARLFRNPRPSPDGRWLAFASADGRDDIYVSASDGSQLRQVTDDAFLDRSPDWMPDGRTLVFYSNRGGAYDLWTIGMDGSGLRRLTNLGNIWFPCAASNARKIAYYQAGVGSFILDLDAPGAPPRGIQQFKEQGVFFREWEWSPDGRKIAMTGHRNASFCCGVGWFDVASGRFTRLTESGWRATWLPDSRRMLYEDSLGLYVVDTLNGQKQKAGQLDFATGERMSLSRDGRTFYYTSGTQEADIWLGTFGRGLK